jgi:periplasmic divalent cation tolerance protein
VTISIGITQTTVATRKDAEAINLKLLENKLIACGQISEIQSMYYWDNKLCNEPEYKITLKHPLSYQKQVFNELLKIHSYDTPEIVFMQVDVNESYGRWCESSCKA